jgi:hypothetical protein
MATEEEGRCNGRFWSAARYNSWITISSGLLSAAEQTRTCFKREPDSAYPLEFAHASVLGKQKVSFPERTSPISGVARRNGVRGATMQGKLCELTVVGEHYRHLVEQGLI